MEFYLAMLKKAAARMPRLFKLLRSSAKAPVDKYNIWYICRDNPDGLWMTAEISLLVLGQS